METIPQKGECVGSRPHVIVVMIGHIESYLLRAAGLSFLRPSEKGFCAVKPVQSESIVHLDVAGSRRGRVSDRRSFSLMFPS